MAAIIIGLVSHVILDDNTKRREIILSVTVYVKTPIQFKQVDL